MFVPSLCKLIIGKAILIVQIVTIIITETQCLYAFLFESFQSCLQAFERFTGPQNMSDVSQGAVSDTISARRKAISSGINVLRGKFKHLHTMLNKLIILIH